MGQVGDLQMTTLLFILGHAVLLHFSFDFLFHFVGFGMSTPCSSGDGNGMTDMRSHLDAFAAEFPPASVLCGEYKLVGAVTFLQAAG